jgi:hypothetical protein
MYDAMWIFWLRLVGGAIGLAMLVASCGGQSNQGTSNVISSTPQSAAVNQDTQQPELSPSDPTRTDSLTPLTTNTAKSIAGSTYPKMDWFDALEILAERFPTFAGYTFSLDRSRLIIYTTDQRSDRSRKMRDTFVALVDQTTGFPEATDAQGNVVNPGSLPFTYDRAKFSRAKLNQWRSNLRKLLFVGKINKLSITDETNLVNVQVKNIQQKIELYNYLKMNGVLPKALNITLGSNSPSKTLFDTFAPPAGGVNIQYGSITDRSTLGLPVLVDNVASYLTASHCSKTWGTSRDGTVMTQNAVKIGDKNIDNPLISCSSTTVGAARCQSADTTIFTAVGLFSRGRIIQTVGGTGSITTATGSDTYYDVTSISERPAPATIVSSIGATSGFRDATVVNADTDLVYGTFSPPIVIKRVVEVNRAVSTGIAAGCPGDSGGPWFQITGTSTAKFLGIYTGQNNNGPSKTRPDNFTVTCGFQYPTVSKNAFSDGIFPIFSYKSRATRPIL